MDSNIKNNLVENIEQVLHIKKSIQRAGGLFYQYRPCRLDDFTIYDIENISNGVVYAQTPLNMNDPFDSLIGFSAIQMYNELIDVVLNALDYNENAKCILGTIVKHDLLGDITEFVHALNELKKQIVLLRKSMHQEQKSYSDFLSSFRKQIYQRLPKSVKKYFTDQSFTLFGQLVNKIVDIEISEQDVKNLIATNETFEAIKKQIITLRDDIYIPKFEEFLSRMNVSCFSISGWDNILMWSHYANSYRGICVEYDFNQLDEFIGFVQRVDYTSKRPIISLKDLGITGISFDKDKNAKLETVEPNLHNIIDYLCVKSPKWNYEEEWRIISPSSIANEPTFIKVPKIKSITLGLKMDPLCRKLLLNVCEEQGIDCYELVIGWDDFSINRRKIDYSGSDFNIDLEAEYIELLGKNISKSTEKINDMATKASTDGVINYRSLITSNQLVIDTLANVYFIKICINKVMEKVVDLEHKIDVSPTKDAAISFERTIEEIANYYTEQQKSIDTIPLVVRLHNETIRDIEKQLFRIDALLTKFKEKPWANILLIE